MPSSPKKFFSNSLIFDVWENVYEPSDDSVLFAESLDVNEGQLVLDMGTGCGILGILSAKKASAVWAVDINPHAILCAKVNARINRVVDKMSFVQSNLFSAFRENTKFDLILFNAPYLPTESNKKDSWLEFAWAGGTSGREIIDCFIHQAPKHLETNGHIFLMQSTLSNVDETIFKFKQFGLPALVVAELTVPFFEKIVLVKICDQL